MNIEQKIDLNQYQFYICRVGELTEKFHSRSFTSYLQVHSKFLTIQEFFVEFH